MEASKHAPAGSGKASASRNPADKSEVWELFLLEFERQEELWGRSPDGKKTTGRRADAYEPLDKENVVRRLIARLSKEP
jgi:hypothetical protein